MSIEKVHTEKKTLAEILSAKVLCVPTETPLLQAIELMKQRRISSIVVAEKRRPLGILTERDIVRIAGEIRVLDQAIVGDLMSGPVITVNPDIDYREAYQILIDRRIRHLVVVDTSGVIVGVVTESDIRKNLGFEYFVGLKNASDIMTTEVITLPSESKLNTAVKRMGESKISCVLVAENRKPSGIFTERDLVGVINRRKGITELTLIDVMTSPVKSCSTTTTVNEISGIMNNAGIRRLVVVDDNGEIAGLITQHDILKGLRRRFIDVYREIIEQQAGELQSTERQLSEKAIVLENILKSCSDLAIVASDSQCRIIYHNAMVEALFGSISDNDKEWSLIDVLSDSTLSKQQIRSYLDQVDKQGEIEFLSETTQSGPVRSIEFRITEMRDLEKQKLGYVVVAKDISSRRRSEQKLRKLSRVVEHSPNAVMITDYRGTIEYINPKYTHMTGYTPEELIGTTPDK